MEEEAIQEFTAEEKRWKLEAGASKVPQITGAVAGMLLSHYSLFPQFRITNSLPITKRVNIKLSLSKSGRHTVEYKYSSTHLDLDVKLVNFTPRSFIPRTHRIKGWVGPRADLGVLEKRKLYCPYWVPLL